MDSSSYTINAGQSVTFTATVMGNAGTPTGTMTFRDNGASIAGCVSVPINAGRATCTTSALAAGAHPITGLYSGDATYSSGVAGPITQTVKGVVKTKLTIDSSRYTSTFGTERDLHGAGDRGNDADRHRQLHGERRHDLGLRLGGVERQRRGELHHQRPRPRLLRHQGKLFGQRGPRRRRPHHPDRQLTAVNASQRDAVLSLASEATGGPRKGAFFFARGR
jgi:hypothetical protein